jgi:7,8-dihydropterin-6-yl-methyl-4-(beta-D-ribofuranosyl)aminobenzene 5'-phosphate synthase
MTSRHFTQLPLQMLVVLASTLLGGCNVPDTMRVPETTAEPVVTSSPNAAPVSTQEPTALKGESGDMTITVVYDNNRYDPRLRTSWGFSCFVELDETTILFDTGGDAEVLLYNMSVLGVDPLGIDFVVLSHIHGDHTGGLGSILDTGVRPVVLLPRSFPTSFKDQVRSWTDVPEVSSPTAIMGGVYSTGELGSEIIEQSLVLDTRQGLVVITGCAHPGIVNMVRRAVELYGNQIYLVLGGFHLGGKSPGELENIIAELRQLGVQKVAPCHCTGEQAISMFAQEWGDDFIVNGAGRVIEIAN